MLSVDLVSSFLDPTVRQGLCLQSLLDSIYRHTSYI